MTRNYSMMKPTMIPNRPNHSKRSTAVEWADQVDHTNHLHHFTLPASCTTHLSAGRSAALLKCCVLKACTNKDYVEVIPVQYTLASIRMVAELHY